jgi:hypothetical protein
LFNSGEKSTLPIASFRHFSRHTTSLLSILGRFVPFLVPGLSRGTLSRWRRPGGVSQGPYVAGSVR